MPMTTMRKEYWQINAVQNYNLGIFKFQCCIHVSLGDSFLLGSVQILDVNSEIGIFTNCKSWGFRQKIAVRRVISFM